MKKGFNLSIASWIVLLGAFCSILSCRAVDPPPAEVLKAPLSEQLKYLEKVGRESTRERSKVARKRYEEKQQYREAVAAQLDRELIEQRELMIAQSKPSDESSGVPGAIGGLVGASSSRRVWVFLLFAALLLMIHRFRDSLLRKFQKDS
ncbi:MAG: hypothetical protein JWM99_1023 [Verrucomicrobiales bacterium]|jgi:hypothetical protein|nr:hypothetical protein [Verrucomicrobiales bacterium]